MKVAEAGETRIEEDEEELKVTILSRRRLVTYPRIDTAARTILVTYMTEDLPPRTIKIPEEEWTPERENAQIRASIEGRTMREPETYRV